MNMLIKPRQQSPAAPPFRPDFLQKTRHDIRGAMHVVIGMSKVLAASETLTAPQQDIVATLRNNADRTLMLIDDMFACLQSGAIPGKNLTFVKTRLPQKIAPPRIPAAATSAAVDAPPDKNRLALLVEDSEGGALLAGLFLKKLGYDHIVAKSGAEALDKFFKNRYSVVIMDIQMPGMDGLETARRLRALEREKDMMPTPILAVTANATGDDLLFCTKAGMNDYLSKPFELNDLRRKLRDILPEGAFD